MPSRKPEAASRLGRRSAWNARRRPLQERSRAKVEAILGAGIELLAEMDLEDLTTAHIAERAGIPIGSLYHYFPSKEGVLAELVSRTNRRVDSAFAEQIAREYGPLPWQDALARAIDVSVEAYSSDATYVAVWRATRGTRLFAETSAAGDERFAELLGAIPALRGTLRPQAIRAAIRIANTFLDWALEAADARERARVVREMKQAVIGYLTPEFEDKG